MNKCGATKRDGTPCRAVPMKGSNRCRIHGGATPKGVDSPHFKHGRYSQFVAHDIREKLSAFEGADPLDLLDELAMQRALFAEYLKRFTEGQKLTAYDIHSMMDWSSEIGRMVERVVKIRNDSALTAAEVKFLQARIVDVVTKYIPEPDKQKQFILDLFTSADESTRRTPELVGGATD